ncbi:MAG: succinate dehydrogenase [Acidocella sp.]|nr:succinate dehydrogenase [Acidocella sp.]
MSVTRRTYRYNILWNAALIHRLSGIGLVVFLPLHFLVLGLAIESAGKLDSFLQLAQMPVVKLAEFALVFLLVVHLLGGARLLALELLPWLDGQKLLAVGAASVAALVAIIFLIRVL